MRRERKRSKNRKKTMQDDDRTPFRSPEASLLVPIRRGKKVFVVRSSDGRHAAAVSLGMEAETKRSTIAFLAPITAAPTTLAGRLKFIVDSVPQGVFVLFPLSSIFVSRNTGFRSFKMLILLFSVGNAEPLGDSWPFLSLFPIGAQMLHTWKAERVVRTAASVIKKHRSSVDLVGRIFEKAFVTPFERSSDE